MDDILSEYIRQGNIDAFLSDAKKEELLQFVANNGFPIQIDLAAFHGKYHGEKVLLNAYLLGIHYLLNDADMQIIMDAALLHDIGRTNDEDDSTHGLTTAKKIKYYLKSDIYKDQNNLKMIKAICSAHSMEDKFMKLNEFDFELENCEHERYEKLVSILKDADALDRLRFHRTSQAALQEKFLRLDYSKELIENAKKINLFYTKAINDSYFNEYKHRFLGNPCLRVYHGIGFNFFKLDSILKNGIMSKKAMQDKKIKQSRNFNGSNGDLWISVVNEEGIAYNLFVRNGISFELLIPNYQNGVKSTTEAMDKALPLDSGRYDDEVFAFYHVPKENIEKVVIAKELRDLDIGTLNYLNCSCNIDCLRDIVNDYFENLSNMGYQVTNGEVINQIFKKYQCEIIKFEKYDDNTQYIFRNEFFTICDKFTSAINGEIQKMMLGAFQQILNKEEVTIGDVIEYYLNDLGIDAVYNDDIEGYDIGTKLGSSKVLSLKK